MLKVKKQFEKLEPWLQDYWVNKQTGLAVPEDSAEEPSGFISRIQDERLKNPTELLPVLLERFVDQKDQLQDNVPV